MAENSFVAEVTFKLKNMNECLQERRLQWLGYLERMEESAWSNQLSYSKP